MLINSKESIYLVLFEPSGSLTRSEGEKAWLRYRINELIADRIAMCNNILHKFDVRIISSDNPMSVVAHCKTSTVGAIVVLNNYPVDESFSGTREPYPRNYPRSQELACSLSHCASRALSVEDGGSVSVSSRGGIGLLMEEVNVPWAMLEPTALLPDSDYRTFEENVKAVIDGYALAVRWFLMRQRSI